MAGKRARGMPGWLQGLRASGGRAQGRVRRRRMAPGSAVRRWAGRGRAGCGRAGRRRRLILGGSLLCAGVLGAGELVHWWASRSGLGPLDGPSAEGARVGGAAAVPFGAVAGGPPAVVVLGFADAGPRAGRENRARVRAGLRSLRRACHDGPAGRWAPPVLVLAGGAVAGPTPEAELMRRHIRELGYRGPVLLETTSRSTWENIVGVVPLIEGAGTIRIVSDCVHALKARRYLASQRSDLAMRLVRGQDYRFGERILIKPATAVNGLIDLGLSRWVPGWCQWSAPGLVGLRRLAASRAWLPAAPGVGGRRGEAVGGSVQRRRRIPAPAGWAVL
ncbi:hypothetical protein MANAM107_25790 [Actinomyces capricornis]|uniref:DUF218 domain-containing protein n=2 Tax=Actinomyces capricornis TaxID=2755559 RepID=A0ABM7UEY9_9ACTO|nr:hypothetical protein MANAM107_25790 [Actinomyces capricornis]